MDVEHLYRDTWAIPQACCRCGEPTTDGKSFTASFVLDEQSVSLGNQIETTTTTAKLVFPTCAACDRAKAAKSRKESITVWALISAGLVGCCAVANAEGVLLAWGVYFVVMLVLTWGVVAFMDRRWKASADEDMQRRAKLPDVPVLVKRTKVFPSTVSFHFSNDQYGQAFALLNP